MLLLIAAALAECGLSDLDATMQSIDAAFAEMSDNFEPLRDRFRERVDCLSEPLSPKLAARVHRTSALFTFFDSDDAATRLAFARYRALDPGGELPDGLAPRDHPLRELYESADTAAKPAPLPPPAKGWLLVDGEQDDEAPKNLPYVLQHIADDGVVLTTSLVAAGGDPPFYEQRAGTPNPTPEPGPKTGGGGKGLKPLAIAGIGVAGVGLVTYGAAFGTRGAYKNAVEVGDRDRIDKNHGLTNTLTVAGMTLMGAGGGLVIAGVL